MSFKLCETSGIALGRLQRGLRLAERPPLLRLAFAVGMRECKGVIPEQLDSRGPEIPVKVLNGGNEALHDALVLSAFRNIRSPLDASDRRRVCKCLVDYGIGYLLRDYERCEERSDYLAVLAKKYM